MNRSNFVWHYLIYVLTIALTSTLPSFKEWVYFKKVINKEVKGTIIYQNVYIADTFNL